MFKLYQISIIGCLLSIFQLSCSSASSELQTLAISKSQSDTVPFSFKWEYIVLNSKINDTIDARLIYDSGSGKTVVLDSNFVVKMNWFKSLDSIELPIKESRHALYARELSNLKRKNFEIAIGQSKNIINDIGVFPLSKIIGDGADGLVGNDFMSKYVVEIDYDKKYLVLHKSDEFDLPINFTSVPIIFSAANHMYIDATYRLENGKSFTEKVRLDLGDGGSAITINDAFLTKEFDLLNEIRNKKESKNTLNLVGSYNTIVGNIKAIEIGSYIIDTPKVRLLYLEKINKNPKKGYGMSLVGNYVFRKFGKMIIDYPNSKIYLPNNVVRNNRQ